MKLSQSVTVAQGHVIRGRTSKAKAFVEADYNGVDLIKLYQSYGQFKTGEVIERDGVEIEQLLKHSHTKITDAKGMIGKDPDTKCNYFCW
ncbi:MAG: hypothetical protein CM15mV13_2960 [uncultured marine virus]|nr:MAG: hypothetical protein CM15mV13_2960 [uncultured marine virus]